MHPYTPEYGFGQENSILYKSKCLFKWFSSGIFYIMDFYEDLEYV